MRLSRLFLSIPFLLVLSLSPAGCTSDRGEYATDPLGSAEPFGGGGTLGEVETISRVQRAYTFLEAHRKANSFVASVDDWCPRLDARKALFDTAAESAKVAARTGIRVMTGTLMYGDSVVLARLVPKTEKMKEAHLAGKDYVAEIHVDDVRNGNMFRRVAHEVTHPHGPNDKNNSIVREVLDEVGLCVERYWNILTSPGRLVWQAHLIASGGTGETVTDLAADGDGVLAATLISSRSSASTPLQHRCRLYRYLSDSTPDPHFGIPGLIADREGFVCTAVARDSAGRFVVAGYRGWTPGGINGNWFRVERYTAAGALDTSFNGSGAWETNPWSGNESRANDITFDAGGNLIVSGGALDRTAGVYAAVVAKLSSTGQPVTEFGQNGVATHYIRYVPSDSSLFMKARVAADGSLFLAGLTANKTIYIEDFTTSSGFVVKLDARGALQTAFGGIGVSWVPMAYPVTSLEDLAIGPDGKVTVVGLSRTANFSAKDAVVARREADGDPDTTFGNGAGAIALEAEGTLKHGTRILLRPNGGSWVSAYTVDGGSHRLILAELEPDGKFSARKLQPDRTRTGYADYPKSCGSGHRTLMARGPAGEIYLANGCALFKLVGDIAWETP